MAAVVLSACDACWTCGTEGHGVHGNTPPYGCTSEASCIMAVMVTVWDRTWQWRAIIGSVRAANDTICRPQQARCHCAAASCTLVGHTAGSWQRETDSLPLPLVKLQQLSISFCYRCLCRKQWPVKRTGSLQDEKAEVTN